jgi:EAL domain-containing protein (putative c-di-GMP-specific phosphodiesterase class I)
LAVDELLASPNLRISLNVGIESLVSRQWQKIWDSQLQRARGIAQRIVLEIDEVSVNAAPCFVRNFIQEYHRFGVRFALDNFGKGETSFRALPGFLFDILKIDEYFVRNLHCDGDKLVMAKVMNTIADELDFLCVAEKVQHPHEAEALLNCGIHLHQGNLYQVPQFCSVLKARGTDAFALD